MNRIKIKGTNLLCLFLNGCATIVAHKTLRGKNFRAHIRRKLLQSTY